jgi:hypothetical protein
LFCKSASAVCKEWCKDGGFEDYREFQRYCGYCKKRGINPKELNPEVIKEFRKQLNK